MSSPLLYLITPPIGEAGDGEALRGQLREALRETQAAAVQLRLLPADERALVKRLKDWVEIVQEAGAAAILAVDLPAGADVDLATVATRGGADGAHVRDLAAGRVLRERLRGERIVGIGNLRTRHDCMEAGEAGLDYLMFGEPRADDSLPPFDAAAERAAWWAEIFEPPAVIHAPTTEDIAAAVATGAEFVALRDVVFAHAQGPARGLAEAAARIAEAASARAEGARSS